MARRALGTLCALLLLSTASGRALADPLAPVAEGEVAVEQQADPAAGEPTEVTHLAEAARQDMAERFGTIELSPGEFRWASEIPKSGAIEVVISLTDQMAFVYRAGDLIGVTTVSSGKIDHETPTGVFPILAKEKVHRSTKYDDAPMPFMQRLNEYGVAMHGGNVPGYPASHGCIRLPMKFAARLFALTTTGTAVTIES